MGKSFIPTSIGTYCFFLIIIETMIKKSFSYITIVYYIPKLSKNKKKHLNMHQKMEYAIKIVK